MRGEKKNTGISQISYWLNQTLSELQSESICDLCLNITGLTYSLYKHLISGHFPLESFIVIIWITFQRRFWIPCCIQVSLFITGSEHFSISKNCIASLLAKAAAGSWFSILDKNLQNISHLWKRETSAPIDLKDKLGPVLLICWCYWVSNLTLFWQQHLLQLLRSLLGKASVSHGFRQMLGVKTLFFSVVTIQTTSRKQNGCSSSEKLLTLSMMSSLFLKCQW